MIGPSGAVRVMVATKPVDFRKGAEGLAALVRETMGADPFSGAVYVFRAKRADRIKLVFWDGTGVVLVAKRLEDREFRWPMAQDGVLHLTAAQLSALLEGLDWRRVHAVRETRVPVLPGFSSSISMLASLPCKICKGCGLHRMHTMRRSRRERALRPKPLLLANHLLSGILSISLLSQMRDATRRTQTDFCINQLQKSPRTTADGRISNQSFCALFRNIDM